MKKRKILRVPSDTALGCLRGAGVVVLCALLFLAGSAYTKDQIVAVSNMQSQKELPVYCVQTNKPQVALSFDAAWGNEDTDTILNVLAAHNVKVTFFMTGGWVESYPEDVKKIAAAGHDLGNHSENHKNMSQLSASQQKEELMKVHEKVKSLTGVDMNLFRPPYGDYNNLLVQTAKSCGYLPIQWDVDSLDWKDYGVDSIIRRRLSGLEGLRRRFYYPDRHLPQASGQRLHHSHAQWSQIHCPGPGGCNHRAAAAGL